MKSDMRERNQNQIQCLDRDIFSCVLNVVCVIALCPYYKKKRFSRQGNDRKVLLRSLISSATSFLEANAV
jgi:hypothetical protein